MKELNRTLKSLLHPIIKVSTVLACVGLARTTYIRCIYGNFSRDFVKYTVIYGVYIRFWPTLYMCIVQGIVQNQFTKGHHPLGAIQ